MNNNVQTQAEYIAKLEARVLTLEQWAAQVSLVMDDELARINARLDQLPKQQAG